MPHPSQMVLYVNPGPRCAAEPVQDDLSRAMARALRDAKPGPRFRGWHTAACGKRSTNCDYQLADGSWTNSLCVHYLQYHRDEIPQQQLDEIRRRLAAMQ